MKLWETQLLLRDGYKKSQWNTLRRSVQENQKIAMSLKPGVRGFSEKEEWSTVLALNPVRHCLLYPPKMKFIDNIAYLCTQLKKKINIMPQFWYKGKKKGIFYRISISICKHEDITKWDDRMKESRDCSDMQNYHEWGVANGDCSTWAVLQCCCTWPEFSEC